MNAAGHRSRLRITLAIFLLTSAARAADKVEPIGQPPSEISDGLKQAVEQKGYRATLDDGWKAEFWFAKDLATAKKDVPSALYPELSDGEFIGVVNFPQGMSDYRGESLAAGAYTLRYQFLPQDGNHLGVAPNPDFLLASPDESRYSPATCIGCEMKTVMGDPDPKHVSTSYVERQNLTMRMSMRRFTRLTNGFSKKVGNHGHAVAVYFMYYNFCRIHKSLRVTPAMEAGLADHFWSMEKLVALLPERKPAKRGPYKKRSAA